MLKRIAEFSKIISKYAYYPILLGFVGLCSVIVNNDSAFSIVGYTVVAICALLCVIALLSKWLCRKAGIDEKIR